MSIKLRFALLLGMLLVIFLSCLAALRLFENQKLTEALAASQRDASNVLERWLDLDGSSLRQFTDDYSRWDELIAFTESHDLAWADINLRQSMGGFNIQDVWVLTTEGKSIYQTRPDQDAPPLIQPEQWRRVVTETPFPHFFLTRAEGVLEIRGAPIQPSADNARTARPRGWLLSARLWDRAHLDALGKLTESTIRLAPPGAPEAAPLAASRLPLVRPLKDWKGETVSTLYVTRETPVITRSLDAGAFEAHVFIVFGLLVMGALALSLHNWVLKPLTIIGDSLDRQDATALRPLMSQYTELSRIASRVEISFAQQKQLRQDVEERARLGRDLHDGIIQSIYAAGMGLAAARTLIQSDPAEASRRVDQVRTALNETIRDVRNFITGLEPEALQSRTFNTAVAGLFEFFQTSGPAVGQLDIDESVADRLHLAARTTALQVIRECTSNAIRHGKAHHVLVSLRMADDKHAAQLVVVDDGCGFDLANAKHGRGLNNITERARTLGATADIASEIGKGTRTTLLFPLSDSPA